MPHDDLVAVTPRATSATDRGCWAAGMHVQLPAAAIASGGFDVAENGDMRMPASLRPQLRPFVDDLRLRAAFTDVAPTSSRLPFSYHLLPSVVRDAVAHLIGRWKFRQQSRWASFPRWPLDLSADFLSDLAGLDNQLRVGGRTPVLLSHDLDSMEGVSNFLEDFAAIEESTGARSVNFVVPCGYPLDHARLREILARGHSLGVHGYDHGNKTPFAPPEIRQRRLDAAKQLIDSYRIQGYRAPSLLRTAPLLRDLAGRFQFDSSIPTSGGLFPVPNNGCATARPFRVEGIWEVPLSLPRDGSLRFLGCSPASILQLWKDCSQRIAHSGGVVVLLTHCEHRFSGNSAMLGVYREFVEFVASSREFVFSTPEEILSAAEAQANLQQTAA